MQFFDSKHCKTVHLSLNCKTPTLTVKKYIQVQEMYIIFYKFIYFNWRLITLRYCIGFA